MTEHERWMGAALKEAQKAFEQDEVPVGAIVVFENRIIGKGCNQTERLQDPTAHAEMIAITAAASYLKSRRLEGCTLYVTLEPCPMCAGAIVLARIPTLVFGAYDPKMGACSTLFNIVEDEKLNHQVFTVGGVLSDQCGNLLKEFFSVKREEKSQTDLGNINNQI